MAKRKSSSLKNKTQKKKKSKRKETLKRQLIKSVLGVALLIFVVVAAGFLVHNLMPGKSPTKSVPEKGKTGAHKRSLDKKPAFEIYPKKDVSPRKPIAESELEFPHKDPKIAIIIDDLGEDKHLAEKFFDLNGVLTFAILPWSTHHKEMASLAHEKGFETMLHLPMEPHEYPEVDPGTGALLTSMAPDDLIEQLNANLDSVPYIKGVNNHMGSKMTAASNQMYQIFSVLKKRNLYFIDSRTTDETLCKPSARLFKVQFAQRDIFIDNIQNPDAIRKQIDKLVLIAKSHGEAIGIGHPYTITYEVLREVLPDLRKKVKLVPASALVRFVG